jgi:hypothetical protein
MDSHLRAVLPVSTLWSVDSLKEAEMNPTACERLRRVAVEWLIQKRTSEESWTAFNHLSKQIKKHPQAAVTPWK